MSPGRLVGLVLAGLLFAGAGPGCVTQRRAARAQAKVDLGAAYLTEDNPESAIPVLEEAVKLHRRNADAWHTLALAYLRRGAAEKAEHAFKRALRLKPEDAQINLNYAYMLQRTGRNAEAIERLEVALNDLSYRETSKILNNLGYALMQEGELDRAVAVLEEASRRAPNYCQAWYNLGLALEQAAQPGQALDAMDRVVMLCPAEFPEASLKVGELLILLGRTEEARMALAQVMGQWPGTPVSERARGQLAALEQAQ